MDQDKKNTETVKEKILQSVMSLRKQGKKYKEIVEFLRGYGLNVRVSYLHSVYLDNAGKKEREMRRKKQELAAALGMSSGYLTKILLGKSKCRQEHYEQIKKFVVENNRPDKIEVLSELNSKKRKIDFSNTADIKSIAVARAALKMPALVKKQRKCLRCDRDFFSESTSLRICVLCKTSF